MNFLKKRILNSLQFKENNEQNTPLTTVHVSKDALEHNVQQYKSLVGPSVLLAPVIKSNAYGHGMLQVAQLLQTNSNVGMFCVASLSEAVMLRQHGTTKPILVLNIIDLALEYAIDYNIQLVLYDLGTAQELNNVARAQKKIARIHIKIDTGLSRLGILWNDVSSFIKKVKNLSYIKIEGIFTHLAESESEDQTFTTIQLERFNTALKDWETLGAPIPLRHTSCSAAITAQTSSHYNLARVGIGIYGLWPSQSNKKLTQKNYPEFSLIPALTWQTTIIQIKTIPAGSFVGYDRTYQTQQESRIAILAAGYWDGIDRKLSNKGHVVVHNILAPIIGRVAMNTITVDVTNIPQASIGDTVTLLGNCNGITADNIAQHIGTINYEVITRINPLLPRIIT